RREQRQHVGVVFLVRRDDGDEDLRLVLVAFGEQRPDGPIDDSRRKDLCVLWTSLALDEAARDLARRVSLVAVFDREGEEWERAFLVAHRDGDENHRVA